MRRVFAWLCLLTAVMISAFTLLMIYSAYTYADVVQLRELGLDYKNYAIVNPRARNSLIYPDHPKEGINILLNTDVLTYGYWDSTVESLTNEGQYASIGLLTRFGVRASRHLELGYEHHSQHLIDRHHSYMDKFPVEDSVAIRLYIYRAKYGAESLF